MARVLLVDDDRNTLSAISRVLRQIDGIEEIERFENPEAALVRAAEVSFDLVIADYHMPGTDGVHFIEAFARLWPNAYRIIISGYSDRELLESAINRAHIHRFIAKPYDGFLLAQAVQEGIQQGMLQQEVNGLRAVVERQRTLLRQVADKAPELLPPDWDRT